MELMTKYQSYLRYEKNYSSHTEVSYLTDLAQFAAFVECQCEDSDLRYVDGDIVRQWIVSLMGNGLTASSVNRKLSSLKSFYRYLLKIGAIAVNPMKKIVGPKKAKSLPSFVNVAQMETLLEMPPELKDFETYRDHVILELFYMTGMRRAELIGLKDVDVDLSSDLLRVTGKRNKQRLIPFSKKTKTLIESYIERRDELVEGVAAAFFVRIDGRPLYPMLVHRIVSSSLRWIPTLAKTSPHVLRHTFATGMLNNGAQLGAVKELLGHASLASTEIYTHTSFEELKNIYRKAHPRA